MTDRWLRWLRRRARGGRRRFRFRLGLRLDDVALEPDEQDLRIAIEARERLGFDGQERLAWIALDCRDLADRIAWRIDAAES